MATMTTTLNHALKEWSVAVNALTHSETILLLRKGGIREVGGRFTVAHDQVLLYPTYEHQQPHLLKPQYAEVKPVESGWHPERIPIQAWAKITQVSAVADAGAIAALNPFHIWTDRLATERFKWKPKQPLYLLMLRVYRLPSIVQIPYQESYGGCRSWIDLEQSIDISTATPALSAEDYAVQVQQIETAIAPFLTPVSI
ncbi:MAG: DUF1802 family protein [Thainema sp.]